MKLDRMKIILIVIICSLALLSAVSLYGNKVLYKRLMVAQLDPIGSWFEKSKRDIGTPSCIFVGDSRVSQWRKYPPLCNSFMYGFSGFTSSQIRLALPMIIIPESVKIVYLQLGINDLKAISLYENKASLIRANLIENLDAIISFFLTKNINVYITTIIPSSKISYPRKLIWSPSIDESVKIVNTHLKTLNSKTIQVIDVAKDFRLKNELYKDELHLNQLGYDKLNELIMSSFNNLDIKDDKDAI